MSNKGAVGILSAELSGTVWKPSLAFDPSDELEFSRLIIFLISSPLKNKTDLKVINYSWVSMVK